MLTSEHKWIWGNRTFVREPVFRSVSTIGFHISREWGFLFSECPQILHSRIRDIVLKFCGLRTHSWFEDLQSRVARPKLIEKISGVKRLTGC